MSVGYPIHGGPGMAAGMGYGGAQGAGGAAGMGHGGQGMTAGMGYGGAQGAGGAAGMGHGGQGMMAGMGYGGAHGAGVAAGGGGLCCGPAAAGGMACGSGDGRGTGCATGCGAEIAAGNLLQVGMGGGDFIAETSYKYVGVGRGDLAYVVPQRSWLPCILLLVLLLVVVLVVFFIAPKPVTTTEVIDATTKECLFWGDPHVKTFDNGRPSFYGEGEFWIIKNPIKNPEVMIQGRYAGTKYTLGLASTQKVVIAGKFIQGHKIEVEPMDAEFGGSIRVDGQVVLQNFGTYEVGGARITYDNFGELVDQATSQWVKQIVHLDLPSGIRMEVFRWANYLDLRIEQLGSLEGGQDGSCGNNNDIAEDDSTQAIFSRIGPRVSSAECLFTHHSEIRVSRVMEEMLRTTCPPANMQIGKQNCVVTMHDPKLFNACLYDYCFGELEHALQVAKTLATPQELQDGNIK